MMEPWLYKEKTIYRRMKRSKSMAKKSKKWILKAVNKTSMKRKSRTMVKSNNSNNSNNNRYYKIMGKRRKKIKTTNRYSIPNTRYKMTKIMKWWSRTLMFKISKWHSNNKCSKSFINNSNSKRCKWLNKVSSHPNLTVRRRRLPCQQSLLPLQGSHLH